MAWLVCLCLFGQDREHGCCCSVAVYINIVPEDIHGNKILLSRMTSVTRSLSLSIFSETSNLLPSTFSVTRSVLLVTEEVLVKKILCPSIFSTTKLCGQQPGKISKKRLTVMLDFLYIIVTEDTLRHKILLPGTSLAIRDLLLSIFSTTI